MIRSTTLAGSAPPAAGEDGSTLAIADGPLRWSRSDLDRHAGAVAGSLASTGIGPGLRVALLARPSATAVAGLHGIARIGAVAAPVAPGLTASELDAAAEILTPDCVMHDLDGTAAAAVLGRGRPTIDLAVATALPATRRGPETAGTGTIQPATESAPAAPTDPAVVVLTSGTTARPKAVVLSTAAMVASAESWLAALPPASGWLLAVGLSHVAGLGIVWRAALSAVPLVVVERPVPAAIADALTHDPWPSHVSLVPAMLLRILDHVGDAPPPTTLRAVLLGGGPIDPDLVERALAAGWPVVPTYGLSEAGSGVTALATSDAAARPETAGRPLPGVRIRIDEPDADGLGEILVDGPGRFDGYLGDAMATAAALTPDGWLRTGDLGRIDVEGYLSVADRRTDRIVRGGENVSPAEVESVLLAHPAIAEAAVVGRRDPVFGQVPVAVVVLRPDASDPADDDLSRFCRDRLSRPKVPVAFERRPSLPRTANGKLRRAELRAAIETDRTAEELPA
jgi:acyl-CoA synthetase (AMP-forming)/AMP-acid ligase II